MFNLAIIGLGKWGQTLVKSVQNKSKITQKKYLKYPNSLI